VPENKRLYRASCEELSPEWGGRFIPRAAVEEVVRGALGLAGDDAGYNATFWYPRQGGIESLARGLVKDLSGDLRTSARVESIDPGRRHVTLATGEEISFERLVLTIPLPAVVRILADAPAAVREAAAW